MAYYAADANDNHTENRDIKVILVIGACALDRLLSVQTYPQADEKVRSTAYHEMGGGNAANTASAMALLTDASFLRSSCSTFRIKLLTKVGNDYVGKQLIEELHREGVDTSSPLFRLGEEGTTTSVTTVIVSTDEHTRTCIHTPGTCGELTTIEVESASMDEIFENVVHLHSDSRHTVASLALAKEARRRGISVSVDAERDRENEDFDNLMKVATMVFTNSSQLDGYINRLSDEHEATEFYVRDVPNPNDTVPLDRSASSLISEEEDVEIYTNAIKPNLFFNKKYADREKQIVITKGHMGALQVNCNSFTKVERCSSHADNPTFNKVHLSANNKQLDLINVKHKFAAQRITKCLSTGNNTTSVIAPPESTFDEYEGDYAISSSGVLKDVQIVDTTGAGDAFIGGYLVMQQFLRQSTKGANKDVVFSSGRSMHDDEHTKIKDCLQFGCWVGGKKLTGPGSRAALPKGFEVDEILGRNLNDIRQSLGRFLTSFNNDTVDASG